jgi:hypothetical protein
MNQGVGRRASLYKRREDNWRRRVPNRRAGPEELSHIGNGRKLSRWLYVGTNKSRHVNREVLSW